MSSKQGEQTQEVRTLKRRLEEVNALNAQQGDTIYSLRCQLAEARSLVDKHTRGELRRLQRFEEVAKEQFALDAERLQNAHERIKLLHEKLDSADDVVTEVIEPVEA